jgi:hypothetical protein
VNDEGPDWREIPWPKKLLARIAGEVVKSLEVARLGMGTRKHENNAQDSRSQGVEDSSKSKSRPFLTRTLEPLKT